MSSAKSPFNTPLETGVRLLILLTEAYPRSLSLDHLVMMDHIVVHSGDFGGPRSIHPESPYRVAEPYVRRELIQRSLTLFRSRALVDEIPSNRGFEWLAGDAAAPFVETLNTDYHHALRLSARWTVAAFGDTPEIVLASAMGERVINVIGIGFSQ